MHSLFDQLRFHALCSPARPAVILPDRVVTYDMLVKGISSVQAVFTELKADQEKPVGILIDNPARHLIVLLALMKSGFTFTSLRQEQVDLALKCGVAVVLTDTKLPVLSGAQSYVVDDKWFLSPPARDGGEFRFQPDRIVRFQFTSGSTGVPKAIGWSFRTSQDKLFEVFLSRIASHARFLTTYGFSNVALNMALRVLSDGHTLIFSPLENCLQTISLFQVGEMRCSSSQARSLLEMQAIEQHSIRIEKFSVGGQLTVEAADEIASVFKSDVTNTYASTEAGLTGFAAGEILRLRRTKGNCFMPVAEIEIVSDAGDSLPRATEGRIRVRSQSMGWPFQGNLTETDDVKGDGWFYPGDIGLIDADGLLVVTGRNDELINDAGVKFAPEVMEAHLKRHPGIEDVAVVRMPLGLGQAEPWIAVVSKETIGLEAVQEWIGRHISGEMGSARFARLLRVPSIPKTETGKVARQELRAMLRAMQ